MNMNTTQAMEPKMKAARDDATGMEKQRRGRLVFYHANSQGTGSAARMELRMNGRGEDRYDCVFLEMARQKTLAAAGQGGRTPATFDWENKVTVKLDFSDVCEILMVLEGRCERMGGARSGLYHQAAGASTIITLERNEKKTGFFLGISRKTHDGRQVFKGQMLLSDGEALGMRCVLQTSLFFMAFHRNLRAA